MPNSANSSRNICCESRDHSFKGGCGKIGGMRLSQGLSLSIDRGSVSIYGFGDRVPIIHDRHLFFDGRLLLLGVLSSKPTKRLITLTIFDQIFLR